MIQKLILGLAVVGSLAAAEELVAGEAGRPAGPLEPRWGRSSCLAFIGKTYGALGKPVAAER